LGLPFCINENLPGAYADGFEASVVDRGGDVG
jgi:hypothetical protein